MGRAKSNTVGTDSTRSSASKATKEKVKAEFEKLLNFEFDILTESYSELFDKYLDERSTEVLSGRNRSVFITEDYVYKFPNNDMGIADNSWEANHPEDDFIPLAKCEIIMETVGNSEVPILKMERVEPVIGIKTLEEDEPQWAGFVGGYQIGHTKDGKLVAYDL